MTTSSRASEIQPRSLKETISSLPPMYSPDGNGNLRSQIKARISSPSTSSNHERIPLLVVLDDDPTGTQTCHDISVLTVWDVPTLIKTFTSSTTRNAGGFFILTNSRALHPPECRKLITEICKNLQHAAQNLNTGAGTDISTDTSTSTGSSPGKVDFEIVLRSDSTLRGHFPLEANVTESVLGTSDLWILAPFFLQGGRYTIDDTHWVLEGKDKLLPAAQTPFAQDATFGYKSSSLRDWVVEKSDGAITSDKIGSLSLHDIRTGGPQRVAEQLMQFEKGTVVIVNAAAEEDMDVVVLGLLDVAAKGRKVLYRSGAALVSSRLGIQSIPAKTARELQLDGTVGGLVIAGSYVPKTTRQLEVLRERSGDKLTVVVLQVEQLLGSASDSKERGVDGERGEQGKIAENVIDEAVRQAEKEIARGQDVLVMTSRDLVKGKDERESLDIGSVVARSLVRFLQQLHTRPRYIIAKGGITSSDMATKGLRMKCATVVGQAAPGVPLWECFEETSKWAGIPYIVFPGNVGSEDTLFEVVDGWRARTL